MICREIFKTVDAAEHFARQMGACVIGVYSLDKPGTINRFNMEFNEYKFFHVYEDLSSVRAIVVYNR